MHIEDINNGNTHFRITYFPTEKSTIQRMISICKGNLENFANQCGILDWVNDGEENGEHVQEEGTLEYEDFISDNDDLERLIKLYVNGE